MHSGLNKRFFLNHSWPTSRAATVYILYSVIYCAFGHFPAFRMSALIRIAIQPDSTPGR